MKNSYTNEKVVLSKYPSGIAKKENFSVIKENINNISENDLLKTTSGSSNFWTGLILIVLFLLFKEKKEN